MNNYFKTTNVPTSNVQNLVNEITSVVQESVNQPIPPILEAADYLQFKVDGDRTAFEHRYFERRKLLTCYTLYLQHNFDEPAFHYFEQLITSTLDEVSWCLAAHLNYDHFEYATKHTIDLFAAETGQTLVEIETIFNKRLSVELRDAINQQIDQRLIQPFLSQVWDWETKQNNWNSVCSSCMGIIFLLTPELSNRAQLLDRINHNLIIYLDSFGQDGICTEGLEYWTYGFGYFIYYFDLLKASQSSVPFDLQQIKQIAAFPARIQLANNDFANFSDVSADQPIATGILAYCQQHFDTAIPVVKNVSRLGFDHCFRYAHVSRNLWWSDFKASTLQPYRHFFKDAQWLIDRHSDWTVMLKGGSNQESHNHRDIGEIILNIHGQRILTDMGAPIYKDGYFGAERYQTVQAQSAWHSVPCVDQQEQLDSVERATVDTCDLKQAVNFQLTLNNAYGHAVTRHLSTDEHTLRLTDTFPTVRKVTEHFVFATEPILVENGCLVPLANSQQTVYFNWTDASSSVTKITVQNHIEQNETYYRLNINLKEPIFELSIHLIGNQEAQSCKRKSQEN